MLLQPVYFVPEIQLLLHFSFSVTGMYCRLHAGHMLNQECTTTRWGAATHRGYNLERLPTMPFPFLDILLLP